MDKTKLFSYIIITYKNFDGIIDTLSSLFQQDYPSIELIISDDGSPNYDDEIVMIKDYIDRNKSGNIVNIVYNRLEENHGTVFNVNSAIKRCSGYYIKLQGAGDRLSVKDALSRCVNALENNDYDIVFSKLIGVAPDGRKVKHLASCEDDYDLLRSFTPHQLCNRLFARNCLPAPAWAATSSLFERNGLFPNTTRLIEDYPFWITLCLNNEKIGFIDDILVEYGLNGVSSTGHYSELFMEDMFKLYEKHIFPYDKRFGVFQPLYNRLKKMGLGAYMAKARWGKYGLVDKMCAYIKYGLFFLYIYIQEKKVEMKNIR